MDKCWFVLRQSHYPPPIFPPAPEERSIGPICLGHIVPSLRNLDHVLNTSSGPEPYPANMPVWPSKKWNLNWTIQRGHNVGLSAATEFPIAAVPVPVDIMAKVGAAFQRSVGNYWEFERLDTFIIQPNRQYINDSLEDEEVREWIDDKTFLGLNAWTIFMVSGLVIARGAKGSSEDRRNRGGNAGIGVSLPGIINVGADLDVQKSKMENESFGKATDFVWAVRLTKIEKSLLNRKWKKATLVEGATFTLEEKREEGERIDIHELLAAEGVQKTDVYHDHEEDIFVVLNTNIASAVVI